MNDSTSLGDLVRRRRRELGLTQEELAARSSTGGEVVRQSDISRIEHGQIQLPRRSRLEGIARVLDLPLGELLAISGWAGADQLESPTTGAHELDESGQGWDVSLEQLRETWSAYQEDDTRFEQLRPVMLEPWKRCRDVGIDPHDLVFESLPSQEFVSQREASKALIDAARPAPGTLELVALGQASCRGAG